MPSVESKDKINISVRSLVEFILRSGDIDDRHRSGKSDAMQEGSRIHRMLQQREGAEYHAEVPLRLVLPFDKYDLVIDGRANGIITPDEGCVTVDEIKGVYKELKRLKEPEMLHLAQAKCYAFIYALQNSLSEINVRMTYCNMESEEVKYFHFGFTFGELKSFFDSLIKDYRKWADFSQKWRHKRNDSIKGLKFPFTYREGQKELAEGVYRTVFHGRRLFLEAPTGTGKTVSVLFPAIKAMGEGFFERIFYATAKTVTSIVPNETFEILRKQDLYFKTVTLTAKEKVCFTGEVRCNPAECSYAKGHYDRINDALYDFITKEDDHSRKRILEYAEERQVCPFELSLDLSLFCDAVILDYNYCFDPRVKLKRFFGEGVNGSYIFLVDEAHNLAGRAREMYSALLSRKDVLAAKKVFGTRKLPASRA
ncbi:MAG: ATP-dependent DNA helicase, partial [Lachnospiraceae bacterium]|nr:ATP-dependent DNA helicase [Lachnospiraceae bacterium]